MSTGCYVLNVQCCEIFKKHALVPRDQFTGENKREALRAARKAGWTFLGAGSDLCPQCSRFLKRSKR